MEKRLRLVERSRTQAKKACEETMDRKETTSSKEIKVEDCGTI